MGNLGEQVQSRQSSGSKDRRKWDLSRECEQRLAFGRGFLLVNKGACVVIFFLETSQGRRAHNLMKHAAIRVRAIGSTNIQSGVSELY